MFVHKEVKHAGYMCKCVHMQKHTGGVVASLKLGVVPGRLASEAVTAAGGRGLRGRGEWLLLPA